MRYPANSTDLIDYHIWEGAVQRQIDVEKLFQFDTEQTISFEIVFAAFIATVVLGAPRTATVIDIFAPWVAGGLLLMTLVRRLALDNIFVEEERVIRGTLSSIYYLTTFSVVYLSLSLAGVLSDSLGVNIYYIVPVILVLGTYGVVIVYEFVFQDFLFWGAVLMYNQAFDQEKDFQTWFRISLLMGSRLLLRLSVVEYNEDHYAIRRIQKMDLEGNRRTGQLGLIVYFTMIGVLLLFVVGVFAIPIIWVMGTSILMAGLLSLALGISFVPAVALIEFVYGRYGSAEIDDPQAEFSNLRLFGLFYLVVLLHGGLIDAVRQILI